MTTNKNSKSLRWYVLMVRHGDIESKKTLTQIQIHHEKRKGKEEASKAEEAKIDKKKLS